MQVPVWLTFAVAAVVSSFGFFRLKIAFRSRAAEAKASKGRGLYSLPRRTHVLFGVLYLLLGVFLVATALGWVRSPFAAKAAEPKPDPNLIDVTPTRIRLPMPTATEPSLRAPASTKTPPASEISPAPTKAPPAPEAPPPAE